MGDAFNEALASHVDGVSAAPRELVTDRLILRRWRKTDVDPLAAIHADPDVMQYFYAPLTRDKTARVIAAYEASFVRNSFGPWAVEVGATGELVGLAGLIPVNFKAHFTPAVHLTVKLARHAWRHHYGLEASLETIRDGFDRVGLDEIVAFTPRRNEPSWRGMASLGMTHDQADDFVYPGIDQTHPLREHVLFRMQHPRRGPHGEPSLESEEFP